MDDGPTVYSCGTIDMTDPDLIQLNTQLKTGDCETLLIGFKSAFEFDVNLPLAFLVGLELYESPQSAYTTA